MLEKLPNKFGPWVIGDEFFDRTAEVGRLTQLLDQKNNILLVAPRRIGKTSLVRETFRRMEERGEDYPLFVDVQDCKTPEEVIVALALAAQPYRDLASKIADAFSSFWRGFRENVDSVGTSELLELRFREGIAGDWRAKAGKIVQSLAEADRPIAICLDELPVMLNRLVTSPGDPEERRAAAELFLSWLRRTVTAFPEKMRWIICGSIGLEPILARHNLSFTVGHLRAFHLPPWDRAHRGRLPDEPVRHPKDTHWPATSPAMRFVGQTGAFHSPPCPDVLRPCDRRVPDARCSSAPTADDVSPGLGDAHVEHPRSRGAGGLRGAIAPGPRTRPQSISR